MQSWRTFQNIQFYSDSSSEELSSGEDDDIWSPNELIEQMAKASSPEERLHLKKQLLEKFLDQRRPILTSKMREFLAEEGNFFKIFKNLIP